MWKFLILSLFTCFSVSTSMELQSTLLNRFTVWCNNFNVMFENGDHYDRLYKKWIDNDIFIDKVNSQNLTYTLGHNQFSGMDTEEYRLYLWNTNLIQSVPRKSSFRKQPFIYNILELPKSVDWITAGAVTPVKDQGQCGSCWSFSATGALEGAYFNKYQKLQSFSEQNLVDCDSLKNGGTDHGCSGGLMDNAFSWIGKNGGLCGESDYPYVSGTTKKEGTCQKTCSVVSGSNVINFVDVDSSSDTSMMAAVAKQTVSIAIEADQREFQMYKSGVFTGTCGTNLDHGVLIVGYGTLSGVDYYLVKNSWSSSWGDKGYIMLGRGTNPSTNAPYNKGDGQCGLLLGGSYPQV